MKIEKHDEELKATRDRLSNYYDLYLTATRRATDLEVKLRRAEDDRDRFAARVAMLEDLIRKRANDPVASITSPLVPCFHGDEEMVVCELKQKLENAERYRDGFKKVAIAAYDGSSNAKKWVENEVEGYV